MPAADRLTRFMSRLRQLYQAEIMPSLTKQFNYSSPMAVPRLEKIVINTGLGEAIQNPKVLDSASSEIAAISGQKPVITKAKKAIAAFKLRRGMPIGCTVTLRGERMYEFLDRLIHIALPRVRDFRGISTRSFDGRGNYTLGLKDQLIFPEIDIGKEEKIRGLNVTIVTTAKTDEESRALLAQFGMPFMKRS